MRAYQVRWILITCLACSVSHPGWSDGQQSQPQMQIPPAVILSARVLGADERVPVDSPLTLPEVARAWKAPEQLVLAKIEEPKAADANQPRVDYYGEPLPKGAIARMGTIRVRDPRLPFGPTTAFSPDGKILATGGREHIRLWEFPTGKFLRDIHDGDRTKSYCSLVFLPGGRELASLGSHWLCIWDVSTGKRLREVAANGHALASSHDGKLLAAPTTDGSIWVWETATLKQVAHLGIRTHPEHLWRPADAHRPAFSLDSKELVTYWENTVYRWNLASGTLRAKFEMPSSPQALSPDGNSAVVSVSEADPDDASMSSEMMTLWDTVTGKERIKLKDSGDDSPIVFGLRYESPFAFSQDGQTLAMRAIDTIALRDARTGRLRRWLRLPSISVRSLDFSPDGRMVLTVSDDGAVRVWDVKTARERLAIAIWDIKTGERFCRFRLPITVLRSLAFHQILNAPGEPGKERVRVEWELEREKPILEWPTHESLQSIVFAPDGRSLISAGNEGPVRLWDTATGRPLRALEGHLSRLSDSSVAVAPNPSAAGPNSFAITFLDADGRLRVQDQDGKQLRRISLAGHSYVRAMAVTPGGKTLATWSPAYESKGHGWIDLWELPTGKRLASHATTLNHEIRPPHFSPDARLVLEDTFEEPNLSLARANRKSSLPIPVALIRETSTGRRIRKLSFDPKSMSYGIGSFSADGRTFLTTSHRLPPGGLPHFDIVLDTHLWEVATETERFAIEGVSNAALSPDGQTLVALRATRGHSAGSASSAHYEFWDTYSGQRLPGQSTG
jgi:WD40 repeat protein